MSAIFFSDQYKKIHFNHYHKATFIPYLTTYSTRIQFSFSFQDTLFLQIFSNNLNSIFLHIFSNNPDPIGQEKWRKDTAEGQVEDEEFWILDLTLLLVAGHSKLGTDYRLLFVGCWQLFDLLQFAGFSLDLSSILSWNWSEILNLVEKGNLNLVNEKSLNLSPFV
jgi:hypothetical protein